MTVLFIPLTSRASPGIPSRLDRLMAFKDFARTVFVTGAGFTRAFLPNAPLMIDEFQGKALQDMFAKFPEVASLLDLELNDPDHPGQINFERLLTRISLGVPYDSRAMHDPLFSRLRHELLSTLKARLTILDDDDVEDSGELRLFAKACINNSADCITFNYDELLDRTLWLADAGNAWAPPWGYGFPCRSAATPHQEIARFLTGEGRCLLLKLHGSLNWRVPLGSPSPHMLESIRHCQDWFGREPPANHVRQDLLERMLEPEPIIVPPILTKSQLSEQPVFRHIWAHAFESLKQASRIVFLGYSLPVTDLAAGYLFREGLAHLTANDITVVDLCSDPQDRERKMAAIQGAYRHVFPRLEPEQILLVGVVEWIREHLIEWLYDSHGKPIAFLAHGWVAEPDGTSLGIRWRDEIWFRGQYVGDIFAGNRLARRKTPPTEVKSNIQDSDPLPRPSKLPDQIESCVLPDDIEDIRN